MMSMVGQTKAYSISRGCYAKMIGLSEEDEPAIYATTKMESTILENVILDADGIPNFHDSPSLRIQGPLTPSNRLKSNR